MFNILKHEKKLGLALGGGAIFGAAHIGVLKVLEKQNIPVSYICGTSVGSIIGALYAGGISAAKLEETALDIDWNQVMSLKPDTTGFVSSSALEHFILETCPVSDFQYLQIPFRAVATDISSGKKVVFKDGAILEAIKASTLYPGIFVALKDKDSYLVDGGIASNVPVYEVRDMGADVALAIDVIPSEKALYHPRNIVQVIARSVDLLIKKASCTEALSADLLLEPITEETYAMDINAIPRLIELGEQAANQILPELKKKMGI